MLVRQTAARHLQRPRSLGRTVAALSGGWFAPATTIGPQPCDQSYRVNGHPTCTGDYAGNGMVSTMADKTYLVRLKPPQRDVCCVIAESFEIHGEHLVFLNSKGKLKALILLEMVESWTESAVA